MKEFADLAPLVGTVMVAYVLVMLGIGYAASRRVEDVEDYVVAGRRLGFWLATPTLLATWFGAGTLLTATDEVRSAGLTGATLDPIGAGLCLILVGLLFAKPLWEAKILTLPDFFEAKFGRGAEVVGAVLMVPPYFGWIAAQFLALAGMLGLFFGIPIPVGIALVAAVGLAYTVMGGMWAVTMTDALQMALVIVGLGVLGIVVGGEVVAAGGWDELLAQIPAERLTLVQSDSLGSFLGWTGVLLAGALGNIPSQDVMQRVFSARSANVARAACLAAGGLYLTLGLFPIAMGLVAGTFFEAESETLPRLAAMFLHPAAAVVFVVTLMSVVLSTIDSAILAPATVLSRNVFGHVERLESIDELRLTRISLLVVGACSLAAAYGGESAYGLLESGYELGMVSLMAPLAYGVFLENPSTRGALASMLTGTFVWTVHFVAGVETFAGGPDWLPVGLTSMAISFLAYPLASATDSSGEEES